MNIAYFISPHGFGHATRASAVMEAINCIDPSIRFEIYTLIPQWLFDQSLQCPFNYHSLLTDIGIIQPDSLAINLPETVSRLNNFIPFDQTLISGLADELGGLDCKLAMCDISPLGIAVANKLKIPSILIENFTWDWLYEFYATSHPDFKKHIAYLREIFLTSTFHIQTEPVCRSVNASLTTAPVSRKVRLSAKDTRKQLGLGVDENMALITMGGFNEEYGFLDKLNKVDGVNFVITGGKENKRLGHNVYLLPKHSEIYHPDMVNACDLVISKAGYSAVAEVYNAGVPLVSVERNNFREAPIVEAYIMKHMNGVLLKEIQFRNGDWIPQTPDFINMPRINRNAGENGAKQIAEFVCSLQG